MKPSVNNTDKSDKRGNNIIHPMQTTSPQLIRSVRTSRRQRRNIIAFIAFIAPNFILLSIFTFWPIIYSLYLSFFKWNMIAPVKKFIGMKNYSSLMQDPIFWKVVKNTFYLAAGTVFIKLAIALMLALLLNRRMRGRNLYRAIIFSPTFTTSVAVAMVWGWILDPTYGLFRVLLNSIGLRSPNWLTDIHWSMPAVIIVIIWRSLGYDMVFFLAGLQSIPKDLYDAAKVDGASKLQLFRYVTFPLLSPTTFFLTIVSVVGALKAFDIIAIMTDGGPMNSTNVFVLYLYQNAFEWFKTGYASAIALILFVLIMGITLIQTRLSKRWVHY